MGPMKAMVLAAGLGTRLRPLTNGRPKALVEIGGRTMLEITLARLRGFGVRDVIVNVHHFADLVIDYLKANDNFGMRIEVSREDILLDTGGGLKKAAWFFQEGSGDKSASGANDGGGEKQGAGEPFILHNVDVLSTIDLAAMARFHRESGALATLAVQDRWSSRLLLFDKRGELCGRRSRDGEEMARPLSSNPSFRDEAAPVGALAARAFCGVHVISPRIFREMGAEGVFSIITRYLSLAARGEKIVAFAADQYRWRDLGTPESVAQAAEELFEFHL
jgi:NDP-sugar pyrophosphorylase family protein